MNNGVNERMPDPSRLMEAAEQEPCRRVHDDYSEVIGHLRRKKFTFREIAQWLKERGLDIDHNAVWRIYAKGMDPGDANGEVVADEELEKEETIKHELGPLQTTVFNGREYRTGPATGQTPVTALESVATAAAVAVIKKQASSRRRPGKLKQ